MKAGVGGGQRSSQPSGIRGTKMMNNHNNKRIGTSKHLWRTIIIMTACSIIYYLPTVANLAGWLSVRDTLSGLHDFYGLDFYALVYFVPVVYVAYVFGVGGAVLTALITMIILLPYAAILEGYPSTLFRPAAFAIILSAVGAVIAMLQKGDEQRHRMMNELKCLYDVGRAAEETNSVDEFLSSVLELIPRDMKYHGETKVRMAVRGKVFESPGFEESTNNKITEELMAGGEVLGKIEIYFIDGNPYRRIQNHLTGALAERIGGAVHSMELEQSLKGYYEQLEEMVEKRTRDLEQAQEKLIRSERLAAVGELASGVGHELRNPLNVIRNCVYLLNMTLDGKADGETTSTLKLLDQQVDISNRIVTDLLNFTRVRPPSLAKSDLNHLVRESLSWIAVPEKIAVKDKLAGDSPLVMVDPEQVGRAFANVIANAVQSMTGKGTLKLSTGLNGDRAWVRFEDSGCGIPEENLEKIFEPLFTTKPKGIGLGLAITKGLIEQNSGTIEITSQVGKGTAFTIGLLVDNKEVKKHETAGKRAGSR